MLATLRNKLQHRIDKSLFQLRDAEPGEVFLNQRRVFIMPSQPGLAFTVMLGILFIGSVNYNLSLGFALTFLLGACAVIGMHLTFLNLAFLHLTAGKTTPVFVGENALFELHVMNRRKRPRYAIWLCFIDHKTTPQAVDVEAHTTSSAILTSTTVKRGWHHAPRVRLQTHFPLGLLRAWSYWQPDAKTLVYPQPESSSSLPPLPMTATQQAEGNTQAGHEDLAGVRPYQLGDSPKHLAWRQIARQDSESNAKLITKQFDGGAASDLSIDYATLPQTMSIEAKLSRMAGWILDAERQGLPYAFRLNDIIYTTSIGITHQQACLQALALYEGSV